jgi:hypothetical protein
MDQTRVENTVLEIELNLFKLPMTMNSLILKNSIKESQKKKSMNCHQQLLATIQGDQPNEVSLKTMIKID